MRLSSAKKFFLSIIPNSTGTAVIWWREKLVLLYWNAYTIRRLSVGSNGKIKGLHAS